jgi:hypothetical protein
VTEIGINQYDLRPVCICPPMGVVMEKEEYDKKYGKERDCPVHGRIVSIEVPLRGSMSLVTQQKRDEAKEKGICPECNNGNGRVFDGAGSRIDCYSCRGKGTWEAYKFHREFVKGWNAALDDFKRRVGFNYKDTP